MLSQVWGKDLALSVATMIVQSPALARRISLAPRRDVHAFAAYIQAHRGSHTVEQMAAAIVEADPRDLLAETIDGLHPRLHRLMDRLGAVALRLRVYRRLNETLHGPASDIVFDSKAISDELLGMVEQIAHDPALIAARKAIGGSALDLRRLQSTLAYLRASGLACDIEALPAHAGWKAIMRRVGNDIGRAKAPAIPFRAPDGWRWISDVDSLWSTGKALENCVASLSSGGEHYISELISGDAVFFASDDQPTTLAHIRRVGPNLWTLAETTMVGLRAEFTSKRQEFAVSLSACIADVGGQLLDEAPLSAMRSLAWRAARTTDDLEGVEDAA